MTQPHDKSKSQDTTDILLVLGGLVVAGIALSWLVLSKPWQLLSRNDSVTPPPISMAALSDPAGEPEPVLPEPALESTLDNPLRMARLAYEAGMLVEPEGFSAWSLYEQVLEDEPEHPEALDGLTLVADTLVGRGAVALEQGRLDDVRDILSRILRMLPDHDEANALATELGEPDLQTEARSAAATSPIAPESVIKAELAPVPIGDASEPSEAVPEPPPVDPLLELRSSFDQAMTDNRLLTPSDGNAKTLLAEMSALNSDAAAVVEARGVLFDEFLRRASVATDSLDATGAETWIGEAEALGTGSDGVQTARDELTDRLIQAESMKPLPASELTLVEYTAPRYPMRAATRNLEGWVDLEFFVTTDGTIRDVAITEASHDVYFREQALQAVSEWQFEPRVFMEQTIEQRAYTRIRFSLE